MSLDPSDLELLKRHLNGDLEGPELADFLGRVQASPELRQGLALGAIDEALLSEIIHEGRVPLPLRRPRFRWDWAAAAVMLIGLGLALFRGDRTKAAPRVAAVEGSGIRIRGGTAEPLVSGLVLEKGDRVHSQGKVRLEQDGLRLTLGPGTSFVVDDPPILERGSLVASGHVDLGFRAGRVEAQEASLRLEDGESGVRIDVERGSARARPSGGAALVLEAGQAAVLGGVEPVQRVRSVDRAKLEEAVRRGCQFLESRRTELFDVYEDGQRHDPAPRRTYAELAALALHRAGYPDSHPMIEALLGRSLGRPLESTYIASLRAQLLWEIRPEGWRERLRECGQFLVDSQCRNGQWDYGRLLGRSDAPPEGPLLRRREGPSDGDNSVTAYAIQGLLPCRRSGLVVDPEALSRARRWWIACQNPDGGWGYGERGAIDQTGQDKLQLTSNSSYGSGTASGLSSLGALAEMLGPDPSSEAALKRGREWLALHFDVRVNPGKAAGFSHLHWLLAAERAGTLLGTERFGSHEWYAEGTEFLLASQKARGEWRVEEGEFMARENRDVLDTALALLFLLRR